jgi:hypothetical protein
MTRHTTLIFGMTSPRWTIRRFAVAGAALAAALACDARHASAQAIRDIGRTAAGNPVLVESRTLHRDASIVTATVRVKFAKAVKAPGGDWWSSRTRLAFDCTARTVKIFENWYFGDTTFRKVVSHTVSGQPAFGTVMGGSMTSVGYDALCPVKK